MDLQQGERIETCALRTCLLRHVRLKRECIQSQTYHMVGEVRSGIV